LWIVHLFFAVFGYARQNNTEKVGIAFLVYTCSKTNQSNYLSLPCPPISRLS
jgi:hypothetical protein